MDDVSIEKDPSLFSYCLETNFFTLISSGLDSTTLSSDFAGITGFLMPRAYSSTSSFEVSML
jgi:hypothetical protein